jgi:hypothetical protein
MPQVVQVRSSRGIWAVIAALLWVFAVAGGLAASSEAKRADATKYGYVSSELRLPTDNTEARDFGRDVDGDGAIDNQLGQVLATLASMGFDFPGALNQAVQSGDLLMLHELKTPSLAKTKDATWQVFYGEPTPSPDFSGSGSFTIASDGPGTAKLPAKIKNHKVSTAANHITIQLDLGDVVYPLNLELGRVFATCAKSGCSDGRINGALNGDDVDLGLLPALASHWWAQVQRDCPGPGPASCASNTEGQRAQNMFDANDDLVITAQEVRENSLIQALFALDLDLWKANGKPGQDGELDAMSFGLGFEAVQAQLARP